MQAIDITPNAEETTRIYSYILANHGELSMSDFGNYWDFTEAETARIHKAFKLWRAFTDAWEDAGLDLRHMPQTIRTKFIKSAMSL